MLSDRATRKWHVLDQMTDKFFGIGRIEFLHGGLYEGAHKIFKSSLKKGSRLRWSAMYEKMKEFKRKYGLGQYLGL